MIRIVLADDHEVVRQGLRLMLAAEPDMLVVGECGDGLEVVRLVKHRLPDVLVLDVMMPSLNGLEITRRVYQNSPGTRIVILSMYSNPAYVVEALDAGAAAYVLKKSASKEAVRAIRAAAEGRRYLSPPLSEQEIEAYRQRAGGTLDLYETLTPREREVLHLAAEGNTNAQIGNLLVISPRTVEMHRQNLMRKLGLGNQTELVRYALRRGLLKADD